MPRGAHSTASSRVSWSTPALLTPNARLPRPSAEAPEMELTFTMLPPRPPRDHPLRGRLGVQQVARQVGAQDVFPDVERDSPRWPPCWGLMPALLTSTSRRPHAPSAAAKRRVDERLRPTESPASVEALPSAAHQATVSSSAAASMSVSITRAPARTSPSAVARPKAPPAPVMSGDRRRGGTGPVLTGRSGAAAWHPSRSGVRSSAAPPWCGHPRRLTSYTISCDIQNRLASIIAPMAAGTARPRGHRG